MGAQSSTPQTSQIGYLLAEVMICANERDHPPSLADHPGIECRERFFPGSVSDDAFGAFMHAMHMR